MYEAYHDGTSRTEGICAGEDATGLFSEENGYSTAPIMRGQWRPLSGAVRAAGFSVAVQSVSGGRRGAGRRAFPVHPARISSAESHLFSPHGKWAWQVFQWAQMTGAEAGKFLGLVRFSELEEGLLYAEIEPSHDILPVIAPHFAKRLAAESWAIHDVRRKKAVLWEGKRLLFGEVPEAAAVSYSEREEGFRRLWRTYYRHMAIPERVNPDLRRSFMPENTGSI